MLKYFVAVAATITLAVSALYYNQTQNLPIGAELPEAVALFESSLAVPMNADDTSLTLTSNSVRGGGSLSGYNCFTIDEGSAQAEFVCGTASGTAVTNLTRGISPSDGQSEVSSLKSSHRRGASVKITDFPIIQLLRAQNNGDTTYENVLRYAGDVVPSGASDLADVGYVLSVVNGGTVAFDALTVAGRAGETVATGTLVYFNRTDQEWYKVDITSTSTWQNRAVGITQGAGTNGNAIAGTGVLLRGRSTVNSGLTAGSIYYASTSGAIATTSSVFPIGEADSTSVLYFDPTQYITPGLGWSNTFTATNTFSGVTSFSPLITGHASTVLRVYTTTGTTTWTKPAGLEYITVWVCGGGGDGGSITSNGFGGAGAGGSGGCAYEVLDSNELSATSSVIVQVGAVSGTSLFGNFLSGTGGSSVAVNTSAGGAGGTASGGDININGQSGQAGLTQGSTGGDSMFGYSGRGQGSRDGGSVAIGYGAGGGGAATDDTTDVSGGLGAQGIVIVTEYY